MTIMDKKIIELMLKQFKKQFNTKQTIKYH